MSGRAFDVNSEVISGSIETSVMDLGKKSIVGSLADNPISIEGVTPSQERFPTFSPLGLKLIETVSKAKNENYSLSDILKILKDTCAEEKDPLVKEACPNSKDLE
jgi:hypothetical protein